MRQPRAVWGGGGMATTLSSLRLPDYFFTLIGLLSSQNFFRPRRVSVYRLLSTLQIVLFPSCEMKLRMVVCLRGFSHILKKESGLLHFWLSVFQQQEIQQTQQKIHQDSCQLYLICEHSNTEEMEKRESLYFAISRFFCQQLECHDRTLHICCN